MWGARAVEDAGPYERAIAGVSLRMETAYKQKSRFSYLAAGYYDHVIRNEADYLRIWQYMDENPVRWTEDEYYFE